MDSLGNGAGSVICINIIGIIILIISYRKNNGQKILFQKLMKDSRIDLLNLSYISDVLSV